MRRTRRFLFWPRILKYRSMLSQGPGKLKSNPNLTMMSCSRSMSAYLLTYLLSLKLSKLITWSIDGEISSCILPARITDTVASKMYYSLLKFQWPTIDKYRSKMF